MDPPDGPHLPNDGDGVVAEVLRYLQAHPHAADTIEGITRWWLAPKLGTVSAESLERALARLMESGHVQRDALSDGRYVYRRGHKIQVDKTRTN